jgi:hypothetical protein
MANRKSLLSKLAVRNVAHKGLQFIQFRACELIDDAPFPSRSGHLGAAREAEKPTQGGEEEGGTFSGLLPPVKVFVTSEHHHEGRAINSQPPKSRTRAVPRTKSNRVRSRTQESQSSDQEIFNPSNLLIFCSLVSEFGLHPCPRISRRVPLLALDLRCITGQRARLHTQSSLIWTALISIANGKMAKTRWFCNRPFPIHHQSGVS